MMPEFNAMDTADRDLGYAMEQARLLRVQLAEPAAHALGDLVTWFDNAERWERLASAIVDAARWRELCRMSAEEVRLFHACCEEIRQNKEVGIEMELFETQGWLAHQRHSAILRRRIERLATTDPTPP